MASWIGWKSAPSNPQYEELVEKACSPLNLPYPESEDMALNLEICDLIRSKTVPPKPAMHALKQRIGSRNPRVQLSALGLTDVCIKNGGDHFLQEIASREFVDELVGVIKSPASNPQVREMAVRLFQSWAIAFESKRELSLLPDTYRELKNQGISFPPPPTNIPSHLLTTATPPTWIDSDSCMRCRTPFTFTNRKHHCRACGLVFDQACSSKVMPLPDLGIAQDVRVCESCWSKGPKAKLASHDLLSKNDPNTPPVPTKRTLRSGADYDADLQRAIALSLAESQNAAPGRGYAPSQPGRILEGTDEAHTGRVDDEDEELRLAIEASLDEMHRVKPSAPSAPVEPSAHERTEYTPLPTYDLAPREAETMLSFTQTVDHALAFGDHAFQRFPHVHALHEQAQSLSGKLVRNIEEKNTKSQMLAEMQEQLMNAVRKYDTLLTEQENYARHQAELRRQAQERQYPQHAQPQYGYPQYGYPQPAGGQPQYPYQQAYPYGYPGQQQSASVYPSMPTEPYPPTTAPQPPTETQNPYHQPPQQQSSAPPMSYGSPSHSETTVRSHPDQAQPLMANQASAEAHDPSRQPYHQPQHAPPAAQPTYQPPSESQQYPSHAPPPTAYSALPTQETAPYPPPSAAFPAFPDAPTQIPEPATAAEQPKEALLIEL